MAARSKGRGVGPGGTTLEVEIERAREDANWHHVIVLAEQLRQRNDRQLETLGSFLVGEAKLENFLEEYPPKDKHVAKAQEGLLEAKDFLTKTIGDEAKKLGVHLDSYILLGKLNYAMGHHQEALKFYERAQLDTLEEKQLPPRSLKIMAEAFAIRAMCFEKTAASKSTSKAKVAEREASILKSYEIAGDLTLLFLQTADKSSRVTQSTWSMTSVSSSPVPPSIQSSQKLGPILEMALLKAPALNLKAGNKVTAIQLFRTMLQAEESDSTKEIRRNVCCKLAEILLHRVSDIKYIKPSSESPKKTSGGVVTGRFTSSTTDSPWKPRKHAGSNLYVPKNKHEETLLLLLLSENMARKDAILSQAPEFFEMRSTKFRDAIIAYDLTAIALSRIGNFHVLTLMLENSMKFSFNEPHTWTQFGLCLASENKYFRSHQIFRELGQRNQADAGSCLVMAKFCYERLHLYDEGLEWAQRALKRDRKISDQFLKGRCNVYIGIGYLLLVKTTENNDKRAQWIENAETHLQAAREADGQDFLTEFYLAFFYAYVREISRAVEHVKRALQLNPEHLPSLHLMVLLLSSRKEYEEALDVANMTLSEYPDNLPVMSLKVRLEELVHGGEAALKVAKSMLEQWQTTCEQFSSEDGVHENAHPNAINHALLSNAGNSMAAGSYDHINGYATIGRGSNPAMSAGFDAFSDKDSVSLHAHSITASHVEKTLSEVASSLSSPFPRPTPQDPVYTQMRIWLLTAELHLRQGRLLDAESCVNEARALSPLSYHLMHVRGLVFEFREEYEHALQCFENSLGINPTHVASLHHLGKVYHILGFHQLAEQSLKTAVRIDPSNEFMWELLGDVQEFIAKDTMSQIEHFERRILEETERTPTEVTHQTLLGEASRIFQKASECHAIALSLHKTSPILPFTTVPLCFE
eukprot:maker-scaffold58_size443543-snap-gene-2.14 protein:Tk00698 transcript:maker-scaffold58_size443543-snap-gene-2.14-mRNA-1 annotation:"tetratricopeptide repeat protein 7b"